MRTFFYILLISLVFFSCNKSKEPGITYTQRCITKVEGANTGTINTPLQLTVYWPYISGSCDVLDKFEEARQANIIYIKALGHLNGGICTDDAGFKTKIYSFNSTEKGIFELRFLNNDNSFISYFITIN